MPDDEKSKAKQERTPGVQALRLIRNAKQATNDSDGAPTPQAEFLMSQANVMALLDLADAIRGDKQA